MKILRTTLLIPVLLAAAATVARAQGSQDAFTTYLNAYALGEIAADGSGNVWIASNGGVLQLDVGSRTWTLHPARRIGGPAGNHITSVSVAGDGSIWVGTETNGVSVYDPLLDRWNGFEEIPDPRIRVVRTPGTRVLIGTENGLALRLRSQRTDICNDVAIGCLVPSYHVNDYAMLGDTLWVATDEGLGRFNGTTWDSLSWLPQGSGGQVSRSLAVFEGELWEAIPGAVRVLRGGEWSGFPLGAERLTVSAGRLFAMSEGGVREWTGDAWSTLDIPGASGFAVSDLAIVDGLFVLAGNGGVRLWPEGSTAAPELLVPPGPQVADFHRGIAVDASCDVWAGNQEGLLRFDGEAWTYFPKGLEGLEGQWIFALLAFGDRLAIGHCCCFGAPNCRLDVREDDAFANLDAYDAYGLAVDPAGRLWAGTLSSGVLVFEPRPGGGWDHVLTLNNANTGGALRSNSIRALAVTAEGAWFGHEATFGVDYWPHRGNLANGANGSNWVSITERSGLADGSVASMAARGTDVWVGTSTALHRLGGAAVIRSYPTVKPGVPGDLPRTVRAVGPADLGGVWCATNDGLLHLRSRDAVEFDFYDTGNSDLPTNDLFSAALSPCDGSVWIGGAEGIVRVDPRRVTGRDEGEAGFVAHPNPFNPAKDRRRVFIGYATPDVIPAGDRISGAEVFDISGRLVGRFSPLGDEWTWNGANLNGDLVVPGIYVVVVEGPSGEKSSLKLGVVR